MKRILFLFALMLSVSVGFTQSPDHCACQDIEGIGEFFADIDPNANCETVSESYTLLESWQDEDGNTVSTWRMDAPWQGQTYSVTLFCWAWWDGIWPRYECRTMM